MDLLNLDIIRTYMLDLKSSKKWAGNNHIKAKSEPISSRSVQTYIRALKTFVSWLEQEGIITERIAHKIRLSKAVSKQVEILSKDEISKIFKYLNVKKVNRLRDLLIFSAY